MRVKAAKHLELAPSAEALVQEYNTLRFQIEALERRLQTCKNRLEAFLASQPDNSAEIAGWRATLAECERQSVSLTKLREELQTQIFKKYIEPHVSTSHYNQIRMTYKGGGE